MFPLMAESGQLEYEYEYVTGKFVAAANDGVLVLIHNDSDTTGKAHVIITSYFNEVVNSELNVDPHGDIVYSSPVEGVLMVRVQASSAFIIPFVHLQSNTVSFKSGDFAVFKFGANGKRTRSW